eukprot:6193371-Pleurochrysis_carterae.AAC.4
MAEQDGRWQNKISPDRFQCDVASSSTCHATSPVTMLSRTAMTVRAAAARAGTDDSGHFKFAWHPSLTLAVIFGTFALL